MVVALSSKAAKAGGVMGGWSRDNTAAVENNCRTILLLLYCCLPLLSCRYDEDLDAQTPLLLSALKSTMMLLVWSGGKRRMLQWPGRPPIPHVTAMQADEERMHNSVILSLTWLQDSMQEYCEGNILEFFTPCPLIFFLQRGLNLSFQHGVNCTGDYSTYLNVFKLQLLFLIAH